MARRNLLFINGETYHIFNKTIGKALALESGESISHFLDIVQYYLYEQTFRYSRFKELSSDVQRNYLISIYKKGPLVDIFAYAIMPNHYHFLVKQLQTDGIRKFISLVQNSYAKFFNLKSDRDGSLFKSRFKAKYIETTEQFLHVSRYIHLNPITSSLLSIDKLSEDFSTSYPYYVKKLKSYINTEMVLSHFFTLEAYMDFVKNQIEYQKKLQDIKHLLLE